MALGLDPMGLDLIEFVMSVEEKFDLEIPDADAQNLTTPHKLVDYIMTKVKAGRDRGCIGQREFYRLRRALIARHWATRDGLKPDTPLDRIVPKTNRRSAWQHLGAELNATRWPGLVRPKFINAGLAVIAVIAYSLPWALRGGEILRGNLTPVLVAIISTTFVVWVGVATTRPMRIVFPRQYACVGDVAQFLVATNHQPEKAEEGWTREQVREIVRALIIEQFAVTEFTDDSRFVQDMHIDE